MVVFPNTKINLGLKVIGKRTDGYHDIETIFYPVGLCDALEIVESNDGQYSFEITGLPIAGKTENNLCLRALKNLESGIWHPASGIRLHLHKAIPSGSGLGGGSSDGSFTIKLLNDLFSLGLSPEKMKEEAGNLGSDCPFFIRNKPVFASGKGDRFEPAEISISGYTVVIVVPEVHVDTSDAYKMIDEQLLPRVTNALPQPGSVTNAPHQPVTVSGSGPPPSDLKEIVKRPVNEWKGRLINDFEKPVFEKYPEIEKIKEDLYTAGAHYASMSGSGSAIYGIFSKQDPDITAFKKYFTYSQLL